MAWLAQLDTRAKAWPAAFRWPYIGLKWLLVAVGVWCVCGVAYDNWQDGRPGLGLGVVVASTLAIIKGVLIARHRHQQSRSR